MTPLKFSYDEPNDTLTIEGVCYAGELFRAWAEKAPLGKPMWVVSRDRGLLTMHHPSAAELRQKAEEMVPRVPEGSRVFREPDGRREAIITSAGMVHEYPHHGTAAVACTRYFANQDNAAAYYKEEGWVEERV